MWVPWFHDLTVCSYRIMIVLFFIPAFETPILNAQLAGCLAHTHPLPTQKKML